MGTEGSGCTQDTWVSVLSLEVIKISWLILCRVQGRDFDLSKMAGFPLLRALHAEIL